jgi:S1-C subfamily serine protease
VTDPAAAIVRVLAPDGTTAGTGFLVTRDGLILTCTHVVEAAARGYDEVDVVFVQGDNGGRVLRARLEPGLTRPADQEDIACLRLVSADSETLAPTTLGTSTTSVGRTYRTFGFSGGEAC